MTAAPQTPAAPPRPDVGAVTVLGLHRAVEHAVTSAGATMARFWVLHLIDRGYRSTSDIARAAGVAPPTTTNVVSGLVREGLVRRTRDEHDRRRVEHQLTSEGRRALSHLRGEADAVLERVAAHLDPEDAARARDGLVAWRKALDRARASQTEDASPEDAT